MSEPTRVLPMKSPAGWYLGEEYYDEEMRCWAPHDRHSGYYYSKWEVILLENRVDSQALSSMIEEVEEELVRSRVNKHVLAPARTEFLEHVLAAFLLGKAPTWKWNYSINAVLENAICKD